MKFVLVVLLPSIVYAFPPRFGADPFSPLGPWTKRGPPCALPKFIEKLPEEAAEQVRAVWSSYKEGNDCEKEHRETRKIVHGLSEDARDKVFAGRCGPSFLRHVTPTVKKEFRSVWFDHKMNLEEKEAALKKLAYALLTGESLAMFNKWEEELQIRKTEQAERIAGLSTEAKQAYETWKKIRLEERTFLGSLPKDIREELKTLCGFHPKKNENSESTSQSTTTTTTEVATTAVENVSSTTPAPLVENETKEKEFRVFLDVQLPEDFNTDTECSIYV